MTAELLVSPLSLFSLSVVALSQCELAEQELKLAETGEYNKVLVFMEKRLQKQQVTFEGTLQAYEEALKLRRDELNDSARLLFEVRKEKQAEDHALIRYQVGRGTGLRFAACSCLKGTVQAVLPSCDVGFNCDQEMANRQRIDMEEKLERHRQEAMQMCGSCAVTQCSCTSAVHDVRLTTLRVPDNTCVCAERLRGETG